ncbi:hypothetical protein D3C78_1179070 [compost metagenome]
MEDIVHTTGSVEHALIIPNIADIKFQLRISIALAHVILFLLITTENTDLSDISVEETFEDSITERARPSSYQQNLILKHIAPYK